MQLEFGSCIRSGATTTNEGNNYSILSAPIMSISEYEKNPYYISIFANSQEEEESWVGYF